MSQFIELFKLLFDRFNISFDSGKEQEFFIAFSSLIVALALVTILLVTFLLTQSWVRFFSSIFVLIVFLGCLYILKRGRLRLAMGLALFLAHIAHLVGMSFNLGLNDPSFQAVYIIFVSAFYFLGYRGTMMFIITAISWSMLIYLLELFGLAMFEAPIPNSLETLLLTIFVILSTGLILFTTLQRLVDTNEQLRLAKEEADLANRTKSSFLAMMSHELRTPLNSIIGHSDIVREEINDFREKTLPKENADILQADLAHIHRAGRHLLNIINDVLEVSKSEAQADKVVFSEVNIEMLCREVADLVRFKVEENRNEFEIFTPSDSAVVYIDAQKIRLILTNLLQNAAKFTKGGVISLAAVIHSTEEEEPDILHLTVTDTGIGVDVEDQERVFAPFYQVDSTYARRAKGSGLGLTICRRMVELLQGTIELYSAEGEGARFDVKVPIFDSHAAAQSWYKEESLRK